MTKTQRARIRQAAVDDGYQSMTPAQRFRWRQSVIVDNEKLNLTLGDLKYAVDGLATNIGAPRIERCDSCGQRIPKKRQPQKET